MEEDEEDEEDEEEEAEGTSRRSSSSFPSCSRCSVLEFWTYSCPLSLAVASLPEEYRNVGLFLGDDFMVAPFVSGSHLFACLARGVLCSTVDTFYVSLQTASEKCRCIQRLAWSDSGYTPMRQSTRHLADFFFLFVLLRPLVAGSRLFDAVRA